MRAGFRERLYPLLEYVNLYQSLNFSVTPLIYLQNGDDS